MINFLSSYDSENDDDGDEKPTAASLSQQQNNGVTNNNDDKGATSDNSDHESESSPGPGSILNRHQRIIAATTVTTHVHVMRMTEPEPLELLGDSPEFEAHQNNRVEEEDDVEMVSRRPDAGQADDSNGVGGKRSNSADSSEPPEKKQALDDQAGSRRSGSNDDDDDDKDDNRSREAGVGDESGAGDEEASSLARSMIGKSTSDILLPPEPTAQCSRGLQDRIIELLDYTKRTGMNFVDHAERSKSFRNPSIYEKLIQFCKIDENGTNFPPEIYNPYIWGKESFYEELGKVQRQEMERREKERSGRPKHEVPFSQPGLASSVTIGNLDERERKKSKWDTGGGHHNHHHSAVAPGAAARPVVQVLTGTKVIPATGALGPGFSSTSVFGGHNTKHH